MVHERALPGNQARVALAMLAVEHRHPLSRDQIADELWGDRLPPSWDTALRSVISKVRAALGAGGVPPDLITNAFGCYRLRLGGGWLDLDAAVYALHDAERALERGDSAAAAAAATVTCLICRRPFLPGVYGPWTLRRRESIVELHATARQCLAEARADMGDYARSARAAEAALSLDPYREAAYQRLMRSRALAGDRMGAAAVFAQYGRLMRSQLGIEPTAATVAAFRESMAQGAD